MKKAKPEKRKHPSFDPKTINALANAYPDISSFNKRVLKCLSDKREYENQNNQLREANEHYKKELARYKEQAQIKFGLYEDQKQENRKLLEDQKNDKAITRQAKEQNRKLRTTVKLLSFCLVCMFIIAAKLAAS